MRRHWALDPSVTYLNHGSFGACPRRVLEAQQRWRERVEYQPVDFFARDWGPLVREARHHLAEFLDADPDGLVFIRNATEGINAVLRGLRFAPGDEILVTDHEYRASRFVLDWVAERWGATVVEVPLPFVGATPEAVVTRLSAAVTPRTRLALVDHVTSQTGLVLPMDRVIAALRAQGVPVLVDGAHGPGQLDLIISDLAPDWYVGNLHKWVCAPRGAGFLYVAPAHRADTVPLFISHGRAMALPEGHSRLHAEFDWPGTLDPTPWLCVPEALDFVDGLMAGGWEAVQNRNHSLVRYGRDQVCAALGIDAPVPDNMLGAMASVPLPPGPAPASALGADPLHDRLRDEFQIEVPVVAWPASPQRVLRISAFLYNRHADYDRLAEALEQCLC